MKETTKQAKARKRHSMKNVNKDAMKVFFVGSNEDHARGIEIASVRGFELDGGPVMRIIQAYLNPTFEQAKTLQVILHDIRTREIEIQGFEVKSIFLLLQHDGETIELHSETGLQGDEGTNAAVFGRLYRNVWVDFFGNASAIFQEDEVVRGSFATLCHCRPN